MSGLKTVFASAMTAAVMGTMISVPASAHHSATATYVVDQTVEIQGTVVQFLIRNPHSSLQVAATDKGGKVTTWMIEWGAGGALASDNVKADTLKPGDKVIVTGSPARDRSSNRLLMRSIERPVDGWKWAGTFG